MFEEEIIGNLFIIWGIFQKVYLILWFVIKQQKQANL